MIFKKLQQITTLPQDYIRICMVFVVSLIFSYFYRFIKSYHFRVLYSYIGILNVYIVAQNWSIYVFGSGFIAYIMLKYINFKSKILFSVLISLPFLLVIHLQRFLFEYDTWKVGSQAPQMIITTRIIYYGLYLHKNKTRETGIFQYFGYITFFPAIIMGPAFSFQTYLKFIKFEKQYSNIKYSATGTILMVLQGLTLALITTFTRPIFPIDWATHNQYYLNSNLFIKFVLFTLVGFTYRIKYYTGWSFTQAAVDSTGISYDQKGTFKQIECGSFRTEIEINTKLKTQYWNTSIQKWLKECIYQPSIEYFSKKSSVPTILTFLASAVWHGFHLTYYITFLHWGLMTNVTKLFYRNSERFIFLQKIFFIKPILIFFLNFMMSYVVMAAVILDLDKSIQVYQGLHWMGTIFIVGSFIVMSFVPPPPKKTNPDTKKQ